MRTSRIRFFAVAALAAVALAACSSSSKPASPATSPTSPAATTSPAVTTPPTPKAPTKAGGQTVSLVTSKYGNIMVDSAGMTLYVDEKDKPGAPACTGACLTAWPPLPAPGSRTLGPGLTPSMFSSAKASDGTTQLTVNGSPLYTWQGDTKPGDVTGQDQNGFYVVAANGKKYDPS